MRAAVIGVAVVMVGGASSAGAAVPCNLPPAFAVKIEQRGVTEPGGPALVAAAHSPDASGLTAGDRVRQANGVRVDRCSDLERAAAEALAKGLALLLGVERGGALVAVAVPARNAPAVVAGPALGAEPPSEQTSSPAAGRPSEAGSPRAAEPPREREPPSEQASPPEAEPESRRRAAAIVPRREAALPPLSAASVSLRQTAAAAVAALRPVDDAARLSVPPVLYDRRLEDAERAIAGLEFGADQAGVALRAGVEEVLAYHRAAREIRLTILEERRRHGVDRRASTTSAAPYFSDSKVPVWVATYPFLRASLLAPPRETRMFPGEMAGRWAPDRAIELLWARAGAGTDRLAAWVRGEEGGAPEGSTSP